MEQQIGALVWTIAAIALVAVVLVARRGRRRGGSIRGGVIGANYGFLSQDKREAVEYIVEERAEATDPERADGNLPELDNPRRPRVNESTPPAPSKKRR
jgi:hypothetical protein